MTERSTTIFGATFDRVGTLESGLTVTTTLYAFSVLALFRGKTRPLLRASLYTTSGVSGPIAIVAVSALNSNPVGQSVTIALRGSLRLFGIDNTPCYDFADHKGFYAIRPTARLSFMCLGHPLGVDVDTYWFGRYNEETSGLLSQVNATSYPGPSSGMTLSWHNRVVPARSKIVLSTVIRWDLESAAPVLNLLSTRVPDVIDGQAQITLHLSVTDPDLETSSLYAIVDNDYADLFQIATDLASGVVTDVLVDLAHWQLRDGSHDMRIYAIDRTGTISRVPTSIVLNVRSHTPD
jgi:hypothetical protein